MAFASFLERACRVVSVAGVALPFVFSFGCSKQSSSSASAEPVARASQALNWPVSHMSTARMDHAATTLSDGRVLVCGGATDASWATTLDSCELYDPASGTWSSDWPKLPAPRVLFTLTALNGGRALYAGGYDVGTFTTYADAAVGTSAGWAEPAEAIHPRWYSTATRLSNDGVLLVGGADDSGALQSVAELRAPGDALPLEQRWTQVNDPEKPVTTQAHTSTLLADGHDVLVLGGMSADQTAPLSLAKRFTLGVGFRDLADMPVGRSEHTATLLDDGRVLVVGGYSGGGTQVAAEAWLYDPSNDTWTRAGASLARRAHVAGRLGRYVIVAGGNGESDERDLDSVEVFDPEANAGAGDWRSLPSLSVARTHAKIASVKTADQRPALLITGGTKETLGLDSAELIAPKLQGVTCTSNSECITGFCVDGNCCDRACNGQCEACDSGDGVCKNVSDAPHGDRTECPSNFVCDGAGACLKRCSNDDACTDGHYCSGGKCVVRPAAGESCSGAGQCAADLVCADGVCCKDACDGPCESCNNAGECVPFAGKPKSDAACGLTFDPGCEPSCNGKSRTCTPGKGQTCGEASCDPKLGFAVAVGTCNVAGSCVQAQTQCDDYACGETTCLTSCTKDEECATGRHCISGVCTDKPGLGQACSQEGGCASSFACIDGVCCSDASCGADETCNNPTYACRKLLGQTCNFGPECASGNCVDHTCCSEAACDVTDSCATPTGVCKLRQGVGCTLGSDCVTGFCVDAVCCNVAACASGSSCATAGSAGVCKAVQTGLCTRDADCASGTHCASDGKCVQCLNDLDCVEPMLCNPQNVCALPPTPPGPGCSWSAPRGRGSESFALSLLGLAWLSRWRRKRPAARSN